MAATVSNRECEDAFVLSPASSARWSMCGRMWFFGGQFVESGLLFIRVNARERLAKIHIDAGEYLTRPSSTSSLLPY